MKCQHSKLIGLRNDGNGMCMLRGGGVYSVRHNEGTLLKNNKFKNTLQKDSTKSIFFPQLQRTINSPDPGQQKSMCSLETVSSLPAKVLAT